MLRTLAATIAIAFIPAHGHHRHHRHHPAHGLRRPSGTSVASYYDEGQSLACGGFLHSWTIGVANKTLPCGTWLTVCARRCARVQVIDRGPYIAGREYDLTLATAEAIGFDLSAGVQTINVGE